MLSPVRPHPIERAIAWDVVCHEGAVIGRVPSLSAAVARRPTIASFIRIGARSEIGANAVIYLGVAIGEDCMIGDGASIREGVTIGDRCLIGRNVTINYDAKIGNRVRIMDGAHVTGGMEIGDDVFIGVNVTTSNDRRLDTRNYSFDPLRVRPPIIRRAAFIGSGANILPGIEIGEGAVVGADTLVARHVPPGGKLIGTSNALAVL